jgi:hypothetical protein
MATTKPVKIDKIYHDSDGWWCDYAPGWKSCTDPLGAQHTEHEQTRSELMQLVRQAKRCDCDDCAKVLATQPISRG